VEPGLALGGAVGSGLALGGAVGSGLALGGAVGSGLAERRPVPVGGMRSASRCWGR